MRWTLVAVLTLAGSWPFDALYAQQPPSTSPFAPVETPVLDPDVFKAPPPMPNRDVGKPALDKSGKAAPESKPLNQIDIGNSQLQFNANRTRDVVAPGVGIDSGETSNLSSTMGPKQTPVLPDYFGLKLSTPTR
jgi:hypothetical protein